MEKIIVVIDSIADIGREPADASQVYAHDDLRETQVLYNEILLCKDEIKDWYAVEAIEQIKCIHSNVRQGYPGWIRKGSVALTDKPVGYDFTVKKGFAFIRKDPSLKSDVLIAAPIGTRFSVTESTLNEYYRVSLSGKKDGWIDRNDVNENNTRLTEAALREDIVATAKRFLGVPYLWGGRSMPVETNSGVRCQGPGVRGRKLLSSPVLRPTSPVYYPEPETQNSKPITGVDCSGLTNLVFRVNNIDIPRDAQDQWAMAEKITHDRLKQGDLIFISAEGKSNFITHVMLYIGRKRFIEAFETGSTVRIRTFREGFGVDLPDLKKQGFEIDKKRIYFGRVLPTQ